ncbi:MAG: PSD1 and planctomycete cytochrome C domain-containing protein [Candidatus Hydrogenedentota bacterium]
MRSSLIKFAPSITSLFTAISAVLYTVSPTHAASNQHFETNIRPVLAEHCHSCHGADAYESNLRLHTASDFDQALSRGTLLPGDDGSLGLLQSVLTNRTDFNHHPITLSDNELDNLLYWIGHGAPWPETAGTTIVSSMAEFIEEAKSEHWAFQPLRGSSSPESDRNPIDSFVLSKLDDEGLKPSPQADPQSLIRRIHYDLTGLPPTYDQTIAFVADHSPKTIESVIDELLASPHYGERWGRYWLDVARYSDTKGFGRELDQYFSFPHTYRDYIIRSFNEDLPINEFILQQLAADQLALGDDPRPLAALGFITIGRQFPGDRNATLDDQIDVVTRGLQGLTVSCARCHDHKFDPIPTADYYSLYGVFRSSHQPSALPLIETPDESSDDYQVYKAELDKRVKARDDLLDSLTDEQKNEPETKKKISARETSITQHINTHPARPDRAMILADTTPLFDPYIFLRGKEGQKGDAVPRRFLSVLSESTDSPFTHGSGRLDLAKAIISEDNPLTARVFVNRIWMHHFGQALVGTPSDFGYQGERPTHPELLDYLASTFMDDGWSLKKLHKRIMLSNTYLQSSAQSPESINIDPENKLLWHHKRRRLDFEATRDSLLVASGQLDRTLGGHSQDITKSPYSNRRAVYAEIDRQNLPTLFATFDFPTPGAHSARRFETTVPQQSLYMMNNPFVAERARAIATNSYTQEPESTEERIHAIYRDVFSRDASADEIERGLTFINDLRDLPPLKLVMPPEDSDWLYGYGEIDEENGQTKTFSEFPYWNGEAYQGDEAWPEGDGGWAQLLKHGGHPGDETHAVIRRWTSPVNSTISFIGELHHFSSVGNGIKAYIISSREGIIWSGQVQDDFIMTEFQGHPIQKGDTVDLIVASNGLEAEDKFRWHPRLYLSGEDATQYPKQDWLTRFDFKGPAPAAPEPLDPWAQYAQVLLMSNEFVTID